MDVEAAVEAAVDAALEAAVDAAVEAAVEAAVDAAFDAAVLVAVDAAEDPQPATMVTAIAIAAITLTVFFNPFISFLLLPLFSKHRP